MGDRDRPLLLVVDDDPAILPLLEAVLDEEAVDLAGASGGPEALARLDAGLRPDAVILDIMMPAMGGLEVLHRLRERPGFDQVPVILLTARSRSEDVVAGLEAGASDYVVKPFHLAELRARVRSALRLRAVFLELAAAREAALQQERLRVLVETTGGIAHALNQPLTAALLKLETLLARGGVPDHLEADLELVQRALDKVAGEVRRIQHMTRYRTSEYLPGVDILDLEDEG
ncbi:MAG: response regulator [Proteobacteria bacterium]|nr:response regulator [Pseudomonadota bacterium]